MIEWLAFVALVGMLVVPALVDVLRHAALGPRPPAPPPSRSAGLTHREAVARYGRSGHEAAARRSTPAELRPRLVVVLPDERPTTRTLPTYRDEPL